YRSEKEVACWQPRDPLVRFEKYLRKNGWLDDAGLKQLEEEIAAEIKAGVERAEAYESDPLDSFRHTYAEMPASLARQQQEFEEAMAEVKAEETARQQPAEREMAES